MRRAYVQNTRQRGFSLIELLIVTVILLAVVGTVMTYISTAQRRFDSEQTRIDITQESREFMDMMTRDMHMLGYPNSRMFAPGVLGNPWFDDRRVAAGIVIMTASSIRFEGDVDGDGNVDSVLYDLAADFPPNAPVSCPCRLRRTRNTKQAGLGALAQPTNWFHQAAQGIINSRGTIPLGAVDGNFGAYTAEPLFRAFDANGVEIPLPIDLNTINPATTRPWAFDVRTIRVTLNVLGEREDNQTSVRPVITLTSKAKINNY